MSKACVFCNTQENIDVEMAVRLDSGTVNVSICKTHAENATLKSIKKALDKRQKAIEHLKKLAQEQGLDCNIVDKSLSVPAAISPIARAPSTTSVPPKMQTQLRRSTDEDAVAAAMPEVKAIAPVDPTQDIQSHVSFQIDAKAPKVLNRTMQTTERSDGLPITVPQRIVSEAGVTKISIVSTNDTEIQRRTKEMKANLEGPNGRAYAQEKYNVKDCNFCDGTGMAKIGGQACPRCKGRGML
jgi:hypothetical protein